MREILFRGKRVDNGEWVEGYFIQTLIGGKEVSIIVPKGAFDGMRISDKIYQVDPETVGQYTGLTDKNGKKIFEGDCVEMYHFWRFPAPLETEGVVLKRTVIAQAKIANSTVVLEELPRYSHLVCYLDDPEQELEVIGNIHDNPEILRMWKVSEYEQDEN